MYIAIKGKLPLLGKMRRNESISVCVCWRVGQKDSDKLNMIGTNIETFITPSIQHPFVKFPSPLAALVSNNKLNFRSYLASQSFLSTAQPHNLVRRSHAQGERAVSCRCFLSHMISFNPHKQSEVNIIVLISTKRGSDLGDFKDLDRDQACSRFSVEWNIVRGQARPPRLLEDSKSKCVSLPEKAADVVLAGLHRCAESSSK